MDNANQVVDGILGGWVLSGIGEYQSGSYIRLGTVLVSGNPKLDNPTGAKWSTLPGYPFSRHIPREPNRCSGPLLPARATAMSI